MSYDISVTQQRYYTRVVITGAPTIDQLLSLVHLLGVDSGTWKHDLLLVDLRGVSTAFTEGDQFAIGQEAACSLAHIRRIASVVPRERVTRISERAARRNGTNVSVFDDEKDALAWLKSPAD